MKKFLLLLMSITTLNVAFAQRTLTGTVTAGNGEPVVGASIMVKNTNKGTVADLDGKYVLDAPNDAKTLIFSSVGFTTREIEIGASNVIDVSLEEGTALAETVITAFGIKKDKSNLGYGVSQVTAQELTQGHTTNLTNALAAKVPGVRLSGSGGSFSSSSIIVRGFTSFTGSNQPLFVVDGVSIDNSGGGSSLQAGVTNSSRAIDINQEDIESISVLKGAAATTLYGSRAANGVVLITTKTGANKPKQAITYTAAFSNQQVNRLPDYQNTYGQGTLGNFNSASVGSWGPKMDGRKVILPAAYRGLNLVGLGDSTLLNPFPNNVSDLFQIGNNQQHNLSFQGGNDKNTYRLSLGYVDEGGVIAMNRLKRYNVGLNATSQTNSKLSTGISLNYSLNKSIRSPQGNQLANPLFRTWFTPRSWDLTGMPFQSATGANMHYDVVDNPRWTTANNLYNDQVDRLYGNVNANYQLTDWLTARVKVGADYFTSVQSFYDQIGSNGGAATNAAGAGGIRDIRNTSRILNSTFLLDATKKVGDFDLTLILGNEVLDQYRNDLDMIGRGVTVRNFRNLAANTTTVVANGPTYVQWQYRLAGFFANLTTAYKGWATLDLAVRNDRNSILPAANNSYVYYSVAGTINPLKALKVESDILSTLKLRANTGLTGSAKADFRYLTDNYYEKPNPSDGFGPNIAFPYNGLAGFTLQNTAGNPNLKPEFTQSTEGGIELGLFKDRIILNATLYKQKSTEVILAAPNSSAAGIAFVAVNAGSLSTTGKEISLTLQPFKGNKKGFGWSTTFNYTQFKSIVDELAPGVQNIFLAGFSTPNIRLVAGDEYGQIYGNDYNRDANGKMIVGANGLPTPTANVIKIGNPNPNYLLGIANNFSYKGLSLSVLLDIKNGGDIYSRNIADLQRQGAVAETAAVERLDATGAPAKVYKFDAVKADGSVNDIMITAEQYWGNAGKYVAAKGFIYQTDWFRVRELSINYDVPTAFFKNTFIGAISVGFFGRNLYLSAPGYPHLDPEQNVLGVNNAQGLEFNALPQTKSMGFNVKATF